MLLHFSGVNMERIFFFLLFCCCIIEAHPLSIDYTILRTNLAWNYDIIAVYPVLVNRFVVLANERFALSFRSVPRSKEKYELGIFMTIDNAEPQMIWSAGQIVSEKSRLELDSSSGRIILRDGGSKEVWSAGHNVSSWELKSEGTLLFYDANQRVVWSSMDYPTDVAVAGQNFTKLTAGNATAMFQNGYFTVNASSTIRLCQISTEGGVKGQLTSGLRSSSLLIWNSSGLQTDYIVLDAVRNYSFIRLSEDASFMFYGLQNGRRRSEPSDITMSLSSFSYPELEVVTNNFSKMVGKGGFGGVYEGTLLDGKKVAIKKLESNSQGLQEFKSEIETLGKIHHVHLVELLGFCAEGPHKLLVYEFMPNGSLEKWIFSDDFILDWRNRMKILLGTAQGLAYLHEECEPKRLHLDVKPQNILLDDSFNAKVSDFGLCRLLPGDQTSILLTRMMGTFGYLPPEWVNGTVSEKHDVYSFGIVMLETLSGRKSTATIALDGDCLHFLEWVMKSMENGTLIDHRLLMHEGYTEEQSRRATEIALLCIDEDANMRPSMKTVVKLLEDIDDALTQLHGVGQVNVQNNVDEEFALL